MPTLRRPGHHLRKLKNGQTEWVKASKNSQRLRNLESKRAGSENRREFTKLSGLRKLHALVRKLPPGVAYVLPNKVYTKMDQFRMKHIPASATRVLMRTDEPGRNYRGFDYSMMPRSEKTDFNEIPAMMKRMKEATASARVKGSKELIFILHPTRSEKPYMKGDIVIHDIQQDRIFITIGERQYFYKDGKMAPVTPNDASSIRGLSYPTIKGILKNAEMVIQTGLAEKLIQTGKKRTYVIRFFTWKENPTLLELYDLREKRRLHPTQRSKDYF